MSGGARCHDFAQIKECDEANVENLGEEHDAEMGEKSCQPLGLRPKIAPYVVGRLDRILDTLFGILLVIHNFGSQRALASLC
jgi:hypothetical protein